MDPTGAIVSYVVKKLGDLILSEAALLGNTREDLEWVQGELRMMQAFLDFVATNKVQDPRITVYIEDVRKLAFHAEDVLDTFGLGRGNPTWKSFLSCCTSRIKSRHGFGMEVARLRMRVAKLRERRDTYSTNIPNGAVDRTEEELLQFRRLTSSPYAEDEDVVGLDRHVESVTELLEGEGSRRSAVAIVGMGGLGKTTLAKKLYNNLKSSFHCTAWVVVSQKYNILDILKMLVEDMVNLSSAEVGGMKQRELTKKLCEFLPSRKYLIVVDDVWNSEVWDTLRAILPNSGNGSRVIITTRNVEVARLANPKLLPYHLSALNEEDSTRLFNKKAFPIQENGEEFCTGELASLREKIVRKCGGLPLAIIVVGGLLSVREKSPREWRKVAEKIEWHQTERGEQCMGILALSYTDLPVHLRWCFLYLSAIPEDCEVHAKRLMRLWIAEGFINEEGSMSLEETAERYLEELVNRCLIQVVKRTPYGSVEVCRVHDLILDLAVSEANKIRFLDVRRTADDRCPRTLLRRLSLTSSCIKGTTHLPLESNKLRTLLIMDPRDWVRGEDSYRELKSTAGNIQWPSIQRNLKLLRVLELGVYLQHLPDEIEHMVNLRYLSLSSYRMEELPKSLGNLRHLQTLDVRTSQVSFLPVSIWRIKTLRYLSGGLDTRIPAPEASLPIDGFHDLRALRHVCEHPWMEKILPKLSNLRELELYIYRHGSIPDYLCGTINSLQSLNVLILVHRNISEGGNPVLSIDEIFSQRDSHPYLHTIELSFLAVRLSNIQKLPQNLKQVKLAHAKIDHGLIELLGKLPSLCLLKLIEVSFIEEEMIFESSWFPQLTVLVLDALKIRTWELVGQSLPLLREVQISRCPELWALPKSLPLLRELEIYNCPKLQALPKSLSPLKKLKIAYCPGLQRRGQRV